MLLRPTASAHLGLTERCSAGGEHGRRVASASGTSGRGSAGAAGRAACALGGGSAGLATSCRWPCHLCQVPLHKRLRDPPAIRHLNPLLVGPSPHHGRVTDAVAARAGGECGGCASEVVAVTGRPAPVDRGGVSGCGGAGHGSLGAVGSAYRRSRGRLSPPEMAARANRRDPASAALISARWPQVRTEEPETGI